MEAKIFIEIYNSLNSPHKQIVFQTLYLMERKYKHISQNEAIYDEIKKKQNELNIGYNDLYKKIKSLNQEMGTIISKKTYESVMRRKTITNYTFEDICQILQLSGEKIESIKIQAQSNDMASIEWLFNTLTSKNQNAVYTLANLLYVEETLPEYFDDNFFSEE